LTAAEISVFAAASLSDALRDLAARHAKATGDTVPLNFGASSSRARWHLHPGTPPATSSPSDFEFSRLSKTKSPSF
jgi:hypothetical protein